MVSNRIRLRHTLRAGLLALIGVAAMGLGDALPAFAQQAQSRRSLFREADRALEQAREARSDILAPRSFQEGMERYQDAERDFERGRDAENIARKLDEATEYFERAVDAANDAYPLLSVALAARDDATAAEAPQAAPEVWRQAEEQFRRAAREHESGDFDDAAERANRAESLYRDAELQAIKANYLQETWSLLRQAEQNEAAKWAPRTLARASELATQAEQLLGESRYDTDQPRWLAQQAKLEAMHAIYLTAVMRAVDDDELTFEEVMLEAEAEMAKIAATIEIAPRFEAGMTQTSEAIVEHIRLYQDSLARLGRDLNDRRDEVAELTALAAQLDSINTDLQEQLGGLTEERTALIARMDEQARLRQKFATVERMFSSEEARVFREGSDVTIRLVGLSFAVGESRVQSEHHDLLDRVQRAILEFPGARVTVEGHTDSFGGARANQRLSQERAEAVRAYLLGNPGLEPSLIEAIGFGESQPVATNDTNEGRARNRRTDIVIKTDIGMGY